MAYPFKAAIAAGLAAIALSPHALAASEQAPEIARQPWSFGGFSGQFDRAQLQRGFQVYKDVCSTCHGLGRVYFRNLAEPGGPMFDEEAVKALAASWPNQISDGPNDKGEMFDRPAKLSDHIRGPYKNEKEARANQNGAYPPDLSLIAKARGVERHAPWYTHAFLMLGDVAKSYQEGGADYVYALLTGYGEAPQGVTVAEGMNYNAAFPGHQIAMPPPAIGKDGPASYEDKSLQTVEQQARDVTAFLSWAADPTLDQRKRIGWQVIVYLLVTTALLYLGKKRIWGSIKH